MKKMSKRKGFSAFLPLIAILAALLLTACDATGTGTPVPATTGGISQPVPEATAATPSIKTDGGYLDTIKQRGKLIVGVKYDQPGFGLNDPISKKLQGFEIAMAHEFARGLLGSADKVEFIESVSANRIPFLQEDKADIVIATFTINDQRKQQIDFSDVYYVAQQKLLVKKSSPIKSVADLAGKNVATVQGSTSEQNLAAKAVLATKFIRGLSRSLVDLM